MEIFSLDVIFALPSLRQLVQRILTGPPGLIAVTGQPGTGKGNTVLSLALEASRSGIPISYISSDEVPGGTHELPETWDIYRLDGTERSWHQTVERVLQNPCSGIVTDMEDDFALRESIDIARKGRWVFAIIPTPFLGVDAFYYLQERIVTTEQILDGFTGIVSQMLVPQLCRACAEYVEVDVGETRLIYPDADEPRKVWQEAGCARCENRGTRGKLGVHEVLAVDSRTRPILEKYLVENALPELPSSRHISIQTCLRELARDGAIGIGTYKSLIFRNPFLRIYHQKEAQEAAAREARLRAQIAEIRAQAMEEELQTAHNLQMGLMPRESPEVEGLDIAGRCIPANHVGGDFFQYFHQDGKASIAMADVTGHAMEAAVPMMVFSGILDSQVEIGGDLETLFSRLNRSLYRNLESQTFVCFTMLEVDPSTRIVSLCDAGCPYPYHYLAETGQLLELQVDTYPLGVRSETHYEMLQAQLQPGDRMVLCSDGIIEADSETGEQFGFERTAEMIQKVCQEGLSSEATIDRILQEVAVFKGNAVQSDDMTCVVVRVEEDTEVT